MNAPMPRPRDRRDDPHDEADSIARHAHPVAPHGPAHQDSDSDHRRGRHDQMAQGASGKNK